MKPGRGGPCLECVGYTYKYTQQIAKFFFCFDVSRVQLCLSLSFPVRLRTRRFHPPCFCCNPCRAATALLVRSIAVVLHHVARRLNTPPRPSFFAVFSRRAAYQQGVDQQHQQSEQQRRGGAANGTAVAPRARSDAGKDTGLLSAAADLVSCACVGLCLLSTVTRLRLACATYCRRWVVAKRCSPVYQGRTLG